jgi:hypothetical protein
MRTASATITALTLVLHGAIQAGQLRPKVPVMVGNKESTEGCAGTATVAVRGGRTLSLRAGPGANYAILAQLRRGQSVSVCQARESGWVGIVVNSEGGGARDCGLSDAGTRLTAYAGHCDSGWVFEKYLRLQAG